MRTPILPFLLAAALPITALADPLKTGHAAAPLEVASIAFTNNGQIPAEFTCDGAGTMPPLEWSGVPSATKSIAVLVDDPDAPKGTYTHLLLTGISPATTSLPADVSANKAGTGAGGFKALCPPSGTHHYHFSVFALDIPKPRATNRADFLSAIDGHILAKGELVGTYQKRR